MATYEGKVGGIGIWDHALTDEEIEKFCRDWKEELEGENT